MKKLIALILILIPLGLVISCQSEDGFYQDKTKNLQIVSSDLAFTPDGGTGMIRFKSVDPVTVTSEKSWCAASVSGEAVQLTVSPYFDSNETRYCRVTLKAGDESVYVIIQQLGEVVAGLEELENLAVPAEGESKKIPFLSNRSYTFTPSANWFHAEVVDGMLLITVDPNLDPGTRTGTLSYTVGNHTGMVEVIQYPGIVEAPDWEIAAGEAGFVSPSQFNDYTLTASGSGSGKYLMRAIPVSSVPEGVSLKDFIFSDYSNNLRNEILAEIQKDPSKTFADFLHEGTWTERFLDLSPTEYYIVAIGFGDDTQVSGRFKTFQATVEDLRPAYYRWIGKWIASHDGKDEIWTFYEKEAEKSFLVTGVGGLIDEKDHWFDLTFGYNAETNEITLNGQTTATFKHDSYGDVSVMVTPFYTKQGSTSNTRVTGSPLIFTGSLSEDGLSAELTPGTRTSSEVTYNYHSFRFAGQYKVDGSNKYITWTGSVSVPLPLTIRRAE